MLYTPHNPQWVQKVSSPKTKIAPMPLTQCQAAQRTSELLRAKARGLWAQFAPFPSGKAPTA